MMNTQRNTTTTLWGRTTKALGKFFNQVVSLPERYPAGRDEIFPRFPWF
jgi:hypothetical protein